MQDLYYVCAQPASYYYSWQVDAMLLSFQKFGQIDLNKVHVVCATQNANQPDDWFLKVSEKWAKEGVVFEFYEDTRGHHHYISSIRPHILEKHWQKYPWLSEKAIMYHDCDIALTGPIKLDDKLSQAKTCFLSDTKSYIGAKYIESKGHGLLEEMAEIVGIDPELVRSKQEESGGAQYLMKPGITVQFWQDVYNHSERLFKEITDRVHEIKKEEPDWHEIQIWCADMWAVLWNLWKLGYDTPCSKDLDFTWGTMLAGDWSKNAIYHNAGVTKEVEGEPFYKGKYMSAAPVLAPRPNDTWASQKYYDLIKEAYEQTKNMGLVIDLPKSQHSYIKSDGRTSAVYTDVYLTKRGIIYLTDGNKALENVNLWTNVPGWQPEQRAFVNNPVREIDLATYSNFWWTGNIGHALFDGLYPIWCAFVSAGYQNQDFTAITGIFDGDNPKSREAITKFTGRDILELDSLAEGEVIKINTLVVGTPNNGNRVMSADRKLWGEEQMGAMARFRERFWTRLGITLQGNSETKCAIVDNKRYSDKDRQELQLHRDDMNIEYINWATFQTFEEQIKYLATVDILVSGPGNAIMYTPLMKPGSTCINLGWIEKTQSNAARPNIFIDETEFEEHEFPAFMEQALLNTQQDLNILYYNRWDYPNIIGSVVDYYLSRGKVFQRNSLNLAKDSQIYKKYCESVENSAEVVKMMTDLALFPEFLVNEHPACLRSGIIDLDLLRKIRQEYSYDERWVIKTKKESTTHIVVVATNAYFLMGLRFIRQFHQYCKESNVKYHFFSDTDPSPYLRSGMNCQWYMEEHNSWQDATNSKFKNIIKLNVEEQDHIFYFDADTSISRDFSTSWFLIGDLVGGEHFANKGDLKGNSGYDRNPRSKAYIPEDSPLEPIYYYGAFFGGKKEQIQDFCRVLLEWQHWDKVNLNGYEPVVNDESYINKYFHHTPPACVESKDFQFNISDKGGVENSRHVRKITEEEKLQLEALRDQNWSISHGTIVS